jgi:hypothetical protein
MGITINSIQQGEVEIGKLLSANMNTTADQAITINTSTPVRITKIVVTNGSTSLTLAAGGFYTAASKGGNAIVAAAQVYSGITGSGISVLPTIAKEYVSVSTIYFALTVAQGLAATSDIYVFGVVLF